MKVLIIGPLKEPITGVTVSNDLLIKELTERNIYVDFINTTLPFFQENVGRFSLNKLFLNISLYFKAYKIFNKDVIYITSGQSFFGVIKYLPYIFIGCLLKKDIVFHLHGNLLLETYSKLYGLKKRLFAYSIRSCTKGIVLSESLKKNLIPFIDETKIFIVSNFVESKFILSEEEVFEKGTEELRILYLSNLMTEKGVFVFFKALSYLKRDKVNYRCKIAGNIDDKISKDILSIIKSDPHIEYLGVVMDNQKRDLLKWGNLFVFPSIQIEGLPISILEAMGSGNHIISTRQDALLDIFQNNEINFVESGSAIDIYKVILINNFDHTQLKINHKIITDNFNEQDFVNNVLKVFKSK
ncbi:glycosyltransferase family 4 protein [Confluentibacter citreus]|uniref:glycosyltransferase family 4 protein n=1 Tax=Confluentibacter citreus TaxID=2007307 RepID=UPI000C282518|nr:glycosyltransferase family 4 protein [Confluentibacter citreus]